MRSWSRSGRRSSTRSSARSPRPRASPIRDRTTPRNMSMRRPRSFHGARARSTLAVLLVASVLAGCTQGGPAAPPTAAPVHEPGSLRVTVLLDLSGPRWPNGAAQRDAIGLWSDQHASGAPRVNLRIVDVAGSDAKTLIELRRAAVEQGADAIVIGAALDYDAVPQAVQL